MLGALTKLIGGSNDRAVSKLQPIVDEVNELEGSFERLSDADLRARTSEFRERLGAREELDDILPEAFAAVREAAKRTSRTAALRRAANRRRGAPRGQDRRDADGRGQDARRHASGLPERALGRGRPRRHRQRLPGAARRAVDGRRLRHARADGGHASARECLPVRRRRRGQQGDGTAALRVPPRRLPGGRHLRHEQRVRLRLPARQHGDRPVAARAAQAGIRDRRRGGQHPDRRGADTADHKRAFAGDRERVLAVLADSPEPQPQRPLHGGREAQVGLADRRGRQQGRGSAEGRQPVRAGERAAGALHRERAEGGGALHAGRRVRGPRRRGANRRRVHGPPDAGQALLGRAAPGTGVEGAPEGAAGVGNVRDHHASELLPHVRQAGRDDGHGGHGGGGVLEDIQAGRGRGAHQPADGAHRLHGLHLQGRGLQVRGGRPGDRREAKRWPAGARGDDRHHKVGAAEREAEAARHPPRGAERQAARERGSHRSPGRTPRSCDCSHQHGGSRHGHHPGRQP